MEVIVQASKVDALATLARDLNADEQVGLVKRLLRQYTRDVEDTTDPFDQEYACDDMIKVLNRSRHALGRWSDHASEAQRKLREEG